MAQQTINTNSIQPLGGPNTGVGTDQGDSWDTAGTKINANFSELYGGVVNGGGLAVRPAGNISTQLTQQTSTATTALQTLQSFVLPANTLKTVNNGILVTAWGTFAANAAPKNIKLVVGGQSIASGTSTQNGGSWMLTAEVFKSAANTQVELFGGQLGSTTLAVSSTSDTSVDTNTINIAMTCLDASAGASNIVLNGLSVEFFN